MEKKIVDLYSSIFTRKTCRDYSMAPLSVETIQEIEGFISSVPPLLSRAEFTYKILGAEEVKGFGIPNAPHYMLISGKSQPLCKTCAGFLFQHVNLYLYSIGLAACWLAGIKSKQNDPNHIIGFAFGKPAEKGNRKPACFVRKSPAEIAKGTDSRLQAVRLAPSGLNKQPWYFIIEGNAVHVYYEESLVGIFGMCYHHTALDIGIALCHMKIASEHEGKPFRFNIDRKNQPTAQKYLTYIGTVE